MDQPVVRNGRPDRHERIHRLLVRRHLLRNYISHSLEGGLYLGGVKFVSAITLLPVMVHALGGPAWLISLVPIFGMLGWVTPPLLVAHRIERLMRHKPLVLVTGVLQRLPYLLTGLVLVLLAGGFPTLALAALACCPLISGLTGGFGLTAWQELVANTIPPERRSSLWAVRNTMSAGIGLLAGGVVAAVLGFYGDGNPTGYGVLHLVAFAFLVASYVSFIFLRETPHPRRPNGPARTLTANLRQMPGMIRRDKRLGLYLAHRAMMAGMFIVIPFLSIHALATLDRPEEFAGTLLAAQMVGAVAGNILAGFLGDRFGGKLICGIGAASLVGMCVWAPLAGAAWAFWGIYFLLGAGMSIYNIGRTVLGLEICPLDRRASYLAVMSAVSLPSMLAASQLSSVAWSATGGNFACIAILAGVLLLGSLLALLPIVEPRNNRAGP